MLKHLRHIYHFFIFHSIHWRSRKAIESWQSARLKALIPYLQEHIPLFHDVLEQHKVQYTHIQKLSDLPLLPLMNKKNFVGRFVEEYTDRSRPLTGHWVHTSGTSGIPFSPLRRSHVRTRMFADSLHYRFFMDMCPWRFSISWLRVLHIRLECIPRANHFLLPIREFLSDPETSLKKIAELQPDVIESHATILTELAVMAHKFGVRLHPRYAVSGSEYLSSTSRQLIEENLNCEVYNRYGLEEFGTVASECRIHDGFHINSESFVVEILDAYGAKVQDTHPGRVIITDLYNYQMPLIRYETGDRGHMSWEPCECGLSTPRIWIKGRYSSALVLNGNVFHHFELVEELYAFADNIRQYQIAKIAENSVEVRIIPTSRLTNHVLSSIRATIENLVGPLVHVHVKTVPNISRLERGKSRVFVDETREVHDIV